MDFAKNARQGKNRNPRACARSIVARNNKNIATLKNYN
jgi:hypothetical protein